MTQKSVLSFRIIHPYSGHSAQFCSKLHIWVTPGSDIHGSIRCTSWIALHNCFCSSIILLHSAMNDVSLIIGHNSFWSALADSSRYDPFPMPSRINNFFSYFDQLLRVSVDMILLWFPSGLIFLFVTKKTMATATTLLLLLLLFWTYYYNDKGFGRGRYRGNGQKHSFIIIIVIFVVVEVVMLTIYVLNVSVFNIIIHTWYIRKSLEFCLRIYKMILEFTIRHLRK